MTRTLNDMIAGIPVDQQREVEAEAAGVLVVAWLWVRPTAARIIRAAAMIVPMTMAQMRYQDGPWLLGRGARWLVSGWLVAGRSSV